MIADLTFSEPARACASLDRYAAETGRASDVTAEELAKFHQSGNWAVTINRHVSLRLMIGMSIEMAKYFCKMNWLAIHCPEKKSFVTTDNPFVLTRPNNHLEFYGTGIITKGAIKMIPLSKSACLLMADHGSLLKHRSISPDHTRAVNILITLAADRLVVGRDYALVKNLVSKTRLTEWQRAGRIPIT